MRSEAVAASTVQARRPLQLCPPVDPESSRQASRLKLTTQQYIDVMLATVRESGRHATWPTDVIASFLAADVITGTEI
jgi:hypothetical protein